MVAIRAPEIGYFYEDRWNLGDYLQPMIHSCKADYIKADTPHSLMKGIPSRDGHWWKALYVLYIAMVI